MVAIVFSTRIFSSDYSGKIYAKGTVYARRQDRIVYDTLDVRMLLGYKDSVQRHY